MIYLKRFLYIFTIIILYALMIPITILYIVFIPFGMIISFVLTEDLVRYFTPLIHLEKYLKSCEGKLENIFLK